MAYTKIIPIRKRLDVCVNYVLNENKTDLSNAIDYAFNQDKTDDNHVLYQSAINCLSSTAFKDMQQTKKAFGKTGGVQGYHIIQSFKPEELTPDIAHKLGCEFTRQCFGEKYEAIIATHLDRNHLHNHIVINSVSFVDGMKYRNTFDDYYKDIRGKSDALCKEYDLSVIEPKAENKSLTYIDWLAINKGKSSWSTIIKNDLDAVISKAPSYGALLVTLENMGYSVKNEKHLSLKPMGKDKYIRTYRLGKAYAKDEIISRLDTGYVARTQPVSVFYKPSRRKYANQPVPSIYKRYWRLMFLLGKVKRNQAPYNMSAYMKSELIKFDRYKAQFKFLCDNNLETKSDIESRIEENGRKVSLANAEIKSLRYQMGKKKDIFQAVTDYHRYEQPHQLYISGYQMMRDESEQYLKAKYILNELGDESLIKELVTEKADLLEGIEIKKREIAKLKKDTGLCQRILSSSEHIQSKTELKEINVPTRENSRFR